MQHGHTMPHRGIGAKPMSDARVAGDAIGSKCDIKECAAYRRRKIPALARVVTPRCGLIVCVVDTQPMASAATRASRIG